MGEASRWQDAFSTALREQAVLIAGLMKRMKQVDDRANGDLTNAVLALNTRVTQLEKQLNEITKDATSGQEVIHGITGAKYVPLVYTGPSDVPRETYPRSEEQQRHDEALQPSAEGGSVLA